MRAFQEIGFKKAFRFLSWTFVYAFFRCLCFPQLRVLFLRLMGAKIGSNCIIHSVQFYNYYRGSFKNLQIGNDCFVGNWVLFDLAAPIVIGPQVSIGEHTIFSTHLNVGYKDHPLQKLFPPRSTGIQVGGGSFIGVDTTVLDGSNIGSGTFVAAKSLVNGAIPANSLVAGNPAKIIKSLVD